jgi:hypothetical protein
MSAPKQFKTLDELTPAEHETRKYKDPSKKFETNEYKKRRAEALKRAGLEDDPSRSE